MAKKNKTVSLGEGANSFYDPLTRLKVLPNQVIELTPEMLVSKRINRALKNGHLEYSEEEANTQLVDPDKSNEVLKFDASNVTLDEKSLKALKKDELVLVALANGLKYEDEDGTESDYTKEELEDLNKGEIIELLLEDE